jgi:hypothetical protein
MHVYNTARISMRACFDREKSACSLARCAREGRAALEREGLWGRGIQRGRTLPL